MRKRNSYVLLFCLSLGVIACKINYHSKQKQLYVSSPIVNSCDTFETALKRYWQYDSVNRYYKSTYDFSLYESNKHEPFKCCLYHLPYTEIIRCFGKPNDRNETSLFYYTSTDCYDRNSQTCHFMEITLDSSNRIYMIMDMVLERKE